jgi:hypothetical protein
MIPAALRGLCPRPPRGRSSLRTPDQPSQLASPPRLTSRFLYTGISITDGAQMASIDWPAMITRPALWPTPVLQRRRKVTSSSAPCQRLRICR